MKSHKLIVVLGMHRSGTSAITRGLQVMGVELGDRFLPAMEEVNAKGFWEDADLNALNIEMLSALGSDWHYLAPIESSDVETLRKKGFLLSAVELLRHKFANITTFGFKDPRVAKLLPFWKEVFSHCHLDVSYVLALRHPQSVTRSLVKRDGLDAEKSYLLWLGHVITSLSGTANAKRIVIDYDRLMTSPRDELRRTAKCLDLKVDESELEKYESAFLDEALRHTVYELNDLFFDVACPPIVREIYAALLDVASDKTSITDQALQIKIMHWVGEFERIKSSLILADKLSIQQDAANRAVFERDAEFARLSAKLEEVSSWGAGLNAALAERDKEIGDLNAKIEEVSNSAIILHKTVAERDMEIAQLNKTLEDMIVRLSVSFGEQLGQKHSKLMEMSDWADGMRRELERRNISPLTRLTAGISRVTAAVRRRISRTIVGDLVRYARYTRRYQKTRVALEAVRESVAANGGNLIVTFPIITWDFRWQRPQHIVTRLRNKGYAVLYVAMSMAALGRKVRSRNEAGALLGFNQLDRHVQQIWLHSAGSVNVYTDPIEGDDLHNLVSGLDAAIVELKPKSIQYLLQFPGWWPIAEKLREQHGGKVIFDCMDDHSGFSTNSVKALQTEEHLIKHADLVVTSSNLLEDKVRVLNPSTVQVKNGTEFEHFSAPKPNGELDHLLGRPIIGYYGAISDWFDMDIVAHCAKAHPDWHFVLIGATHGADLRSIERLSNVYLLGEKKYAELPGYLAYFDVCTIPFKLIPLTLATNPVKFYEYLSAGKPVVSVALPELFPYSEDCYLAKDALEFDALLKQALDERNDSEKMARRTKLAKANSWDSRADAIVDAMKIL
jgi:glycosyltransferase involved in cell wall biosynthesis